MSRRTPRHEVVVAGGGLAALELVLALNDLAAERVSITIVAPEVEFMERYALRRLADDFGARLVADALAHVHDNRHEVVTASGEVVSYDVLVPAVGARPYPAFRHVITLGVAGTSEALTRLAADLERAMRAGWRSWSQAASRGRCRSTSSRS